MKIAIAGTLDSPINENSSTGTEVWTYSFCKELSKRRHEITLFALTGSVSPAKVVNICNRSNIQDKNGEVAKNKLAEQTKNQIKQIADRQDDFDLVHVSIFSFHHALSELKKIHKPIFLTIHGSSLDFSQAKKLFRENESINYIFVSNFFANHWPKPKNYQIIYNGIDLDKFKYSDRAEDYFLYFSCVSSGKGIETAIKFARISNGKLLIAGPIWSKKHFQKNVEPYLNDKIKYLGILGPEEKNKYLSGAKALIFPTRLPESFGLVAVEALACGTPVIGSRIGAVPEIIHDGVNGFLVEVGDVNAIVEKSKLINNISRQVCRDSAEEFSVNTMVDKYIKYYQIILRNE